MNLRPGGSAVATDNNPVGWFEIPVSDMKRARAFYEHVLEVKLDPHDMGAVKMAWFPMHSGAYGAAGTLVQGPSYEPSQGGTLVYFNTGDIGAALERAAKRGGRILKGRTDIGEYGFIAHFRDCEGNRIGLHSMS